MSMLPSTLSGLIPASPVALGLLADAGGTTITPSSSGGISAQDQISLILLGLLGGALFSLATQTSWVAFRLGIFGGPWGPDDIVKRSRISIILGMLINAILLMVFGVFLLATLPHNLYVMLHSHLTTLQDGMNITRFWFAAMAGVIPGTLAGQAIGQYLFRKAWLVSWPVWLLGKFSSK